MKKIYHVSIEPAGTDCEYKFSAEINEAERGEEWDGDVAGYINNAYGDEMAITENPSLGNIQQNFIGTGIENICLVSDKRNREPLEVWWAADAD